MPGPRLEDHRGEHAMFSHLALVLTALNGFLRRDGPVGL